MAKYVETQSMRQARESAAPRVVHPAGKSYSGAANASIQSRVPQSTTSGRSSQEPPPPQRRPIGQPQDIVRK